MSITKTLSLVPLLALGLSALVACSNPPAPTATEAGRTPTAVVPTRIPPTEPVSSPTPYSLSGRPGVVEVSGLGMPLVASLSPDGKTVLVGAPSDSDADMLSVDVETGASHSVTLPPYDYVGPPSWSPDGRWIGYQVASSDTRGIWITRVDGDERHLLRDGEIVRWSFDGHQIMVAEAIRVDGEHKFALHVLDTSTERGDEVFRHDGLLNLDVGLAWAPDGKRVALAWAPDALSYADLFVIDLETQEVDRLSDDAERVIILGWTCDGNWLAVTALGVGSRFLRYDGECWVDSSGIGLRDDVLWWSFSATNSMLLVRSYNVQKWYLVDLTQLLGPDFPEGVLSCP